MIDLDKYKHEVRVTFLDEDGNMMSLPQTLFNQYLEESENKDKIKILSLSQLGKK